MFEEVGVPFGVFLILIYLTVIVDAFNFFAVFAKQQADKEAFCKVGLKWARIALGGIFSAFLFYFVLTQPVSVKILWIELIALVLMLIDTGFSIFLKIRYRK